MEKLERYDSYKDSGIEWLGEIPSHWSRTKLKSLLDIKTGKKDVNASDENGKYPFFTCASEPHKINTYTYDCEALLVAGNGIVGNTQYYNGKFDAYQRTYILYQFRNVLSVSFIKHYIQGLLKTHLADKSNGSVIDFIKVGDLRDFIVSLPPLEEQQKIAQYLDTKIQAMDSAISKKQQLVEKLKLAKQALITQVVTKGLDPNVPMKDSGVEWLGDIPKNWVKTTVKNVFGYVVGGTPISSRGDYYASEEDGNTWITISDMGEKYLSSSKAYISEEGIKNSSVKLIPENSLLFSFKLSVGTVGFNTKPLYTNEAIASFLRSKTNQSIDYAYYAIPVFLLKNTIKNIYGADMLNQELIKNARIVLPPLDEQLKLTDYLNKKVSEFDQLIKLEEDSIEALKKTKQKLITEVVTGKIDVRNEPIAVK